jgi:iron complex transport system substrate-binding protein
VSSRWVVILSLVAACSARGPAASDAPVRVVSLHDVTTELVVALDATARMVGIEEPVDVSAEVTSALSRVPRIGDLESILAVRPTVVVGLAIVAAKDPELVARLREAGVEVYLAEPTSLDDVFGVVRGVAARIGATAAGDRLAGQLQAQAAALAPGATAAPQVRAAPPMRVFVYDCCDPPFTAGGRSVLGDLIRRAGGENVFGDVAAAWTHVSWEEVVARRPALIVINEYAYAGQGGVADKQRAVDKISALADVPTVVIPLRDALGGIHSLDGLARLRAAIGPGT